MLCNNRSQFAHSLATNTICFLILVKIRPKKNSILDDRMKVFVTVAIIVAAGLWLTNRLPEKVQRPIRLHYNGILSNKQHIDLLQPKPTLAPEVVDMYKSVYKDVALAIHQINKEAASRDTCQERTVVQELDTIKDSVYSKSLTLEESKKCANIAVDALNVALGGQENRLSIVHVDAGVKVAPSMHIIVPFLYYDIKSNSSAKLVVTLGELEQGDCDTGKARHSIQQIAPFNTVEPHWNF